MTPPETNQSRRKFIGATAGALVVAACAPALRAGAPDHDLVLRNGIVFDGLGGEGRASDVAISGGRITAVESRLSGRGREEIDVRGLAVAPGFIDIHSHGDGNLNDDPRAESVVRQGVTTIVVGADGSSRAHGSPERGFPAYFASVDALRPESTLLR